MTKLPELLKKRAEKLLRNFTAELAADPLQPRRVDFQIEGRQVNLFERHAVGSPLPVAQLRYSPELSQWTLHYQNGNRWQLYLNVNPTLELGKLLLAIRQDPLKHFWTD